MRHKQLKIIVYVYAGNVRVREKKWEKLKWIQVIEVKSLDVVLCDLFNDFKLKTNMEFSFQKNHFGYQCGGWIAEKKIG